jgi:very-short-patch-repair endonuclease
MVAIYRGRCVAIECDGEQFHSGDDKVRSDMERQAILERLGWRFIRIRGSEYYRNPNTTIERVIKELNELGILPERFAEPAENFEKKDSALYLG